MDAISGTVLAKALIAAAKVIEGQKDYLCMLDSEVGDGDHGVSMTIGMRAIRRVLATIAGDASPSDVFQAAAEAYADEVGATIGPLYEAAFAAAAHAVRGKTQIGSIQDWAVIYRAMVDAIQSVGHAERGDKTLLDAFIPAVEYLENAEHVPVTLKGAGQVALQAAIDSRTLAARKGRASRLGDRSIGHQDAGATSLALFLGALADAIDDHSRFCASD